MESSLLSSLELYNKINESTRSGEKICIIFGAGASYGYAPDPAVGHFPYRPPTVAHLFDKNNPLVQQLVKKYPNVFLESDFIEQQIIEGGGDFEDYLSKLYRRDNDHGLFWNLVSYLEDLIFNAGTYFIENNYYRDLIQLLSHKKIRGSWSFITFNYDTILERSMMAYDMERTFNSFNNYVDTPPKIFKVHGGINYRYVLEESGRPTERTKREIFQKMMDAPTIPPSIVSPLADLPQFHTTRRIPMGNIVRTNDIYNFPQLMIPIHDEQNFNPFFADMIQRATSEINSAELVIAIGYDFGDTAFTDSLKRIDTSNKELILVGTKRLYEETKNHSGYKRASEIWNSKKIKIFAGDGFAEFVKSVRQPQVREVRAVN